MDARDPNAERGKTPTSKDVGYGRFADPNAERLLLLVDRYLFGVATTVELADLEQHVVSNPSACELFWKRVSWHALVREHSIQSGEIDIARSADLSDSTPAIIVSMDSVPGLGTPIDYVPAESLGLAGTTGPSPSFDKLTAGRPSSKRDAGAAAAPNIQISNLKSEKPPVSPVLGFLGGVVSYVNQSRTMMFWLIASGLFGWFAFQAGSLIFGRLFVPNEQLADGTIARPAEKESPAEPALGPAAARLTRAIDCQWAPASAASHRGQPPLTLAQDTEIASGQVLHLSAGLAELTFHSGAKVILHAPAQFVVTSPLGGELHVGRLTAKVPHTAAGFTVNTPAGKVVDLGTEFGVTVSTARTMEVVVFVGEVAVSGSEATAGVSHSGSNNPPPTIHVSAGHAVQVASGQPGKVIASDDSGFVRSLDHWHEAAEVSAAYLEFIKKLKPVVWFRMEGKDADRVVHDEMSNAPDGEVHWDGPGKAFVGGRVGKGLWLRGPKLGDYALVPDYPKADKGRLSVAAWVYADSHPNYAGIAKNWGNSGRGQFEFTLMGEGNAQGREGDLGLFLAQADGKQVILREGSDHPLPLYQWQHVAFTTDGTTARLYRQGREVASIKHNGLHYPVQQKSLGIGVKISDDEHTPAGNPSYWSGKIDELTIFNATLSPDDIRRLANAPPQ